ncbi:hypothetical protein [Kibdelosporangium phytohabitans]|uniref:hypothetical protein n=1 Tax=Kibdelosporangium phytohabitans TaxID=860235 RepID=UPI0019FAE6CE|nr:hypothetical protein [Kibdelosporangium phytohabitans]MBE1469003.1 hypothetical protein [Kibdelosporangium phytohabitans]
MELHDVDAFGMLDSPAREPDHGTPAVVDRMPAIRGNGNDTALRDIHKPRVTIGTALIASDLSGLGDLSALAVARSGKRSGRGLQDRDALRHLAERYVVPPGLLEPASAEHPETAFGALLERRVLLVTSEVHDGGQFTACLRLAYEVSTRHPEVIVREELIDQLHAGDLLVDGEPAVVLGDLRDARDKLEVVRRGLVEFARHLYRQQSYLILIIPADQARRFEDFLPGRVHHLRQPEPVEVFRRHVRGFDADPLAGDSDFADQIRDMWPPEIRELADAVSDRINQGDPPADALKQALRGRADRQGPALREIIRSRQEKADIEWLALLLAATLLEGATPWHIVDAADRLLERNGAQPRKAVPLLRPSPYARLVALDYEPFDSDSREFRPHGTGTEVLRHFWREHRDLRGTLLTWIGELPHRIVDLAQEDLERLADRCAELADDDVSAVLRLAAEWTAIRSGGNADPEKTSDHRTAQYRRSIAVRLLTTTATDPALGTRIRDKLLTWSRTGNAETRLLTAEVCAAIGKSFPRIALTRLKHLADFEDQFVNSAVLQAVRQIGADLGTSSFLRYVSEWFENATPARLNLLAQSVAAVLVTRAEQVDIEPATSFWRHALDTMPPEDLRRVVAGWLSAAVEAPPAQRDAMVEPLVLATGSDPRRIAQMHYASRFTRTDPTDALTATLRQLSIRLDEVDPVWG